MFVTYCSCRGFCRRLCWTDQLRYISIYCVFRFGCGRSDLLHNSLLNLFFYCFHLTCIGVGSTGFVRLFLLFRLVGRLCYIVETFFDLAAALVPHETLIFVVVAALTARLSSATQVVRKYQMHVHDV